MNENVTVCITPKGEKPVLHFSQYDNERVFTVTVLADDGESAAVLTDLDIEFRIRKTDSHVVTIPPESVADNVITFKTTDQVCACCGQNIASVVLMKDDMIISTLDILVDIQRDILSGGLPSASDINNLTSQIEQIIPEVLGDDYYTKTEVDELIDDIPTFDPTNYYDKDDVNTLLADKANVSNVYSKTETNLLLFNKISAPAKSSVSGLPMAFPVIQDAGIDCPVYDLKTSVSSGDKSATLVSFRGTNMFGGVEFAKTFSGCSDYALNKVTHTVTFTHAPGITEDLLCYVSKMPFKANTQYTIMLGYEAAARNTSLRIFYTDNTSTYLDLIATTEKTSFRIVSTANKTIKYIAAGYWGAGLTTLYYDECGIFEGSVAATDFEAFEGNVANIDFGTTLDQAGVLDCISGLITLEDTNTIQCDGIELDTYTTNNTIYSSTGNITSLGYFTSGTDFFDYLRLIKR